MVILLIIFYKLYYSVYLQDLHLHNILLLVIGTISTIFYVPTYNTAKM